MTMMVIISVRCAVFVNGIKLPKTAKCYSERREKRLLDEASSNYTYWISRRPGSKACY